MVEPLLWSSRNNWGSKYWRLRRGVGRYAQTVALVKPKEGGLYWEVAPILERLEGEKLPRFATADAAKTYVATWAREKGL